MKPPHFAETDASNRADFRRSTSIVRCRPDISIQWNTVVTAARRSRLNARRYRWNGEPRRSRRDGSPRSDANPNRRDPVKVAVQERIVAVVQQRFGALKCLLNANFIEVTFFFHVNYLRSNSNTINYWVQLNKICNSQII